MNDSQTVLRSIMKLAIEKNEIYELEILDLTYQGFGVAKVDGFPIFIENTLPGELVEIRVTKVLKKFAFGMIVNIITASPDRVEIKDAVGTRVGTMPLQHISYPLQLKFKRQQVLDSLDKVLKVDESIVYETIGMENPWEYRNKAQVPVREINGVLETGFFKRGSHDLVPIENFYIQDPKIDEAVVVIRDIARELEIPAYNEKDNTGVLRHIMVRRGHYTGEVMVVLITNAKDFEGLDLFVEKIAEQVEGVVSIVQNMNMKQTNVILGRKTRVLFGDDFYHDRLLGMDFTISKLTQFKQKSFIKKQSNWLKLKKLTTLLMHTVVLEPSHSAWQKLQNTFTQWTSLVTQLQWPRKMP